MAELTFIKDYRNQSEMRESFIQLAQQVFGIDFTSWHEHGYWTEKYIPYSYSDGEKIIANVSVNLINLVVRGKTKRAIQIGTVMTHPEYRGRGLSRKLMEIVLKDFEGAYDIMYLFANRTVLDFYPKFGFHVVEETQYTTKYASSKPGRTRKLSPEDDLSFIYEFAKNRVPVSMTLGTVNTEELLMFYCLAAFPDDIYYLEDEEAIVIYQTTPENEVHIFEIVSQKKMDLHRILDAICTKQTRDVIFHFTVDQQEGMEKQKFHGSEVMFVRMENEMELPTEFKHPITSQA
ncbi:GNAT family N-acetyltransferase [Fictibacillus aquaticus]|uniref:N-acetyltransferase domain-containing protein n=1 Tax=Fictibacillus aquaticus TaxID=2021314 RepID=A0A235F5V1_9BACL|nr:GNAT family N-acetyltransferase [Fictibacillus aquaticus]OYD56598.1 hypothetical protein CGZ90_16430 [Fictibacillus aquaticus]